MTDPTRTTIPEGPDFLDPEYISDGEDYLQDGEVSTEDREYLYPLTAFVPKGAAPVDERTIPSEAAYWIIPDINNVALVRQCKVFELTWMKKVPASFTNLYVRVDRRNNNQADPTPLQRAVLDSVVTQFKGRDGMPAMSQTYLVPVLRRYEGKWTAALAEMGLTTRKNIRDAHAKADDYSDGRISLKTRPVAVWKSGKGKATEFHVRIDKSFDGSVADLIAEHADELAALDPRAYAKLRGRETEKFFSDSWRKYKAGEKVGVGAGVDDGAPANATERYIDALMDLSVVQLKSLLSEAHIETGSAKTKAALAELATANQETLEAAVLSLAAQVRETPPF